MIAHLLGGFMMKQLIITVLFLATSWAMVSAADLGIGFQASAGGYGLAVNEQNQGYGDIVLATTLAIKAADGWEIDPIASVEFYSEEDETGASSTYTDGYTATYYGLGAAVTRDLLTNENFRILAGVQGNLNFGTMDIPGFTGDASSFVLQASVPVAVEFYVQKVVGIRFSGHLARASIRTTTYSASLFEQTETTTNFDVGGSNLSVGLFYYF